jgi:hypothetical protein
MEIFLAAQYITFLTLAKKVLILLTFDVCITASYQFIDNVCCIV